MVSLLLLPFLSARRSLTSFARLSSPSTSFVIPPSAALIPPLRRPLFVGPISEGMDGGWKSDAIRQRERQQVVFGGGGWGRQEVGLIFVLNCSAKVLSLKGGGIGAVSVKSKGRWLKEGRKG